MAEQAADLLVRNAKLVATGDAAGREIAGGWVAVTRGLISGVGASTSTRTSRGPTVRQ
jgi:hypothetical protein